MQDKKRYIVVAASLLMQCCLGGVYAWSVFVAPLKNGYNMTNFQAQLIFGCTIACFALSMLFAGKLQDRKGPRIVAFIGGIFFGAGYLIASASNGSFIQMLLGIGCISGIGIGFSYVCPLATCVKWFPNHKGLITGISVAGFGGGAMLLTMMTESFLSGGMDVLKVFQLIGIIYGVIVAICALFLFVPENFGKQQEKGAISARPSLIRREFWLLLIGMFSGTFAGLLVIGNLKPMGLTGGLTQNTASWGISVFAFGNAIGRIAWGRMYDKLGSRVIPISLLFTSIVVLSLLASGIHGAIFIVGSALVGIAFSACFVLYAAHVSTVYGSRMLGSVYPIIFLAYGVSAIVGPPLGGWIVDTKGSYNAAIIIASLLVGLGALSCFFIDKVGESSR
jgi:MFS transporter, OFA family, oxalate/formate antiporter